MKQKRFQLLFFLCFLMVQMIVSAAENLPSPSEFQNLTDEYRPWTYYWWLKGNVTEESITADLTRMKELGFGGLLVFDSRGYHEDAENHIPVPIPVKHEFMSPEWQDLILHLIFEADRLDMKVSLNLSNTGGHLRGPWDFGAEGPRTLIYSSAVCNPNQKISLQLIPPEDQRYFQNVLLLAVRTGSNEAGDGSFSEWIPARTPEDGSLTASEVIDLSEAFFAGKIEWNPPANETGWRLLWFGSVVISDVGSIDILNPAVVEKYYDKMAGTLIRRIKEEEKRRGKGGIVGRTLTGFYNVSWEGGNPNWTDGFDRFFAEKRGYDCHPFMPVLAGIFVDSPEKSRRFLADFHKTAADAFCENCYRRIGDLCHRDGLIWHSEDGGPWNRTAPMFSEGDMLTFWGQNDIAQGEFWMDESYTPSVQSNAKFAASASHIYEHLPVALEAFTHMTYHWSIYPALLKPSADKIFVDGGNMFLWHTYTAPVPGIGKPGYEYFAGTHINSNVTWQEDAAPFISYLTRCQTMLRRGKYEADFCVYVSDRNYRIWGRSRKWNEKSGWGAPEGTASDLLDTNTLLNRLEWKEGWFTLPDGMSYRFLVVDPEDEEIPVSALQKIASLAELGGTVILGPNPPLCSRGLSDGEEGDLLISELSDSLWETKRNSETVPFGNGKLYRGTDPAEVMVKEGILPDFEGPLEYHHRRLNGGDIYFITNPKGEKVSCVCRFRTNHTELSLWNPVTGEISAAESCREGERISLPISLPEYGSIFVLCSDESPVGLSKTKTVDEETVRELSGPWQVQFDPEWGGPAETVFPELVPWNEMEDSGIRFYSGTAVYRKILNLTAEDLESSRLILDLGKVAVTARVKVNGIEAGIVWTVPWQVDLKKEGIGENLYAGENQLEIEVTNCWVNRLIGDAGLTPEKRYTETNVQLYPAGTKHHPWQGYTADDPLRESGLIGPVRIIRYR